MYQQPPQQEQEQATSGLEVDVMADSKKYGRTANLFDYKSSEIGAIDVDTGQNVEYDNARRSDYILVKANDTITISGQNSAIRIFEYDANKTYLGVNFVYNNSFSIANSGYIRFAGGLAGVTETIMVNTGSTALPYQPYLDWQHSLRKLTTATEAVENPLYSDGTAITAYTIKGNTVQNGTPRPNNPISVQGVGEKSENLFDGSYTDGYIGGDTGTRYSTSSAAKTAIVKCEPNTTYTIKKIASSNRFTIATSSSYPQDSDIVNVLFNSTTETTATITTPAGASYLLIYVSTSSEQATPDMMLNTGSTAKSYEPYGYKIPILSAGVTTHIYLGSTQTTRLIKKLVLTGDEQWQSNDEGTNNAFFYINLDSPTASYGLSTHFTKQNIWSSNTVVGFGFEGTTMVRIRPDNAATLTTSSFKQWLAAQYANGTPVIVWYVLATPETAIVNEPLMKIGDYADTLSNAASIPTTEGANSITVDTTVQPSEFSATWTGWHDAEVKEKSENIYDKYNTIEVEGLGTRYGQYVEKGIYSIYNDTDNTVIWGAENFRNRYTACGAHSTATIDMTSYNYSNYGFIMAYNDTSLGDVSIVEGSTVPDHYIPYWK